MRRGPAVRRLAALLVTAVLGVILAAKRTGHIAEVRPVVDELLRQGFWVAPRLVKQALLVAAEEGPDGSRS